MLIAVYFVLPFPALGWFLPIITYVYGAKLLNADWLRQRAFFSND